jgi:DNA-binding IscR family transcriptional regulator
MAKLAAANLNDISIADVLAALEPLLPPVA